MPRAPASWLLVLSGCLEELSSLARECLSRAPRIIRLKVEDAAQRVCSLGEGKRGEFLTIYEAEIFRISDPPYLTTERQ